MKINPEDIRYPALVASNRMALGLGNRIRFTLSCQAIAEAENRNFYYYWPVGPEFGARFDELWEYDAVQLTSPGPEPYLTQWSTSLTALDPHRNDPILSIIGSQVVKGFGGEASWESKLLSLQPVPVISSRVATILKEIGSDFIGVQVRASHTTHEKTLKLSPTSWFIDRMKKIQADVPNTCFFLSCDDSFAQKEIQSWIPNVYAASKSAGFNTRSALIESVIDLYILAKSRYLIGPVGSSFVSLARVLSNYSQDFENSQGGTIGRRTNKTEFIL